MSATAGVFALALLAAGVATPSGPLRVRASSVIAPCVQAAVHAWPAADGVEVETAAASATGPADVIVASSVELTRALESGAAEIGSEVDVARVPWVVQVRPGGPASVRRAADVAASGAEVAIPDSPAAYEARRWATEKGGGRVRAAQGRALREAPLALVPLSLAGEGERLAVDVPPIVARAAVAAQPARPADARALVAWLGSEPGQRAFSECRAAP
jgi:extracellular solute-binding protein